MRWWVYARRLYHLATLIVSAGASASCVARLGDLRPGVDAGSSTPGATTAPVSGVAATHQTSDLFPATETAVSAAASSNDDSATDSEAHLESASDGVLGRDGGDRNTVGDTLAPIDAARLDAGHTAGGCPTGSVVSDGGAGECLQCAVGGYCGGNGAPFVGCDVGTWDDDADPATPCVSTTPCLPGQRVSSEGDAIADRGCSACEQGYYSDAVNALACEPWSNCLAPDDFEASAPAIDRDRQCGRCAALTVSLENNAKACAPLVHRLAGGYVAIEAELPHAVTNAATDVWSAIEVPNISGGRGLEVGPDDKTDWTTAPYSSAPRLDYLVEFAAAGTYYIHIRGDAGANSDGYSDSCYAAIDGVVTDWFRFDVNGGTWGWSSMPVAIDEAGVHVVSIVAREDGFRVDKLVISTSEQAPTGNGPEARPPVLAP